MSLPLVAGRGQATIDPDSLLGNEPDDLIFRAADRFPLPGAFRVVSDELPDDDDQLPYGLTRVTVKTVAENEKFRLPATVYCQVSQMARLGDEFYIFAGTQRDIYCDDRTEDDHQVRTDKVYDRSVPDD